jgi:hypothetical protein
MYGPGKARPPASKVSTPMHCNLARIGVS